MADPKLVDIAVEVRAETDRAWRIHDGFRTEWVPKSQCELEGNVLTMPEWLAKEKGFI